MLSVQEYLNDYRIDKKKLPYYQTPSHSNMKIEQYTLYSSCIASAYQLPLLITGRRT